jgi:hypothetical protein
VRLDAAAALARLADHHHGVLGTVHPERGVDLVPVVFAVAGGHVGIPVDVVKPKASTSLQRERNLAADPRASLLVEGWDPDDWSRLWWVRAELRAVATGEPGVVVVADELVEALARAVPQYRDQPFARVLVFRIAGTAGWTASG